MNKSDKLKWSPKPGLYQCVIPNGRVHVDIYMEGRSAEPAVLTPGDEIELYERELRVLRRSEILELGYLAPLMFYEKDPTTGDQIEVEVDEDSLNPNIINDDLIYAKVQLFKNAQEFADHLQGITSILTANRFKSVCATLDVPQSYLTAVDNRIAEISEGELKQMYVGPIDAKRQDFLTPKINA